VLAALAALVITGHQRAQTPLPPADLVLTNGIVLTVDASDRVQEAIAISGGTIAAVGSNEAVKARIGPATQVIDLHGRTATPGLIDTHVHFSEVDVLYDVTLSDVSVRRLDDVVAKVREQVAKASPATDPRQRLGRRQARRAALHHGRRSR
jgi:predicted amidohydrolase YtcJ